uniref:hypothetical protein n=1 Tax=Pedobacter sp. ASV28 TaxID=2795123 RepID=UPI0018ED6C00
NLTGTGRLDTGLGLGVAPNTTTWETILANTTTKSQLRLNPSTVDVSAPANGDIWNNAGELKFMENAIVNRILKSYNNELFKSDGNYFAMFNQYGDMSATVKAGELWVYDTDVLAAITSATWTSNRATLTPANGKIMLKGQLHDDGVFTYLAVDDNKIRRW